jgi:hypothetical protein
MIAAMRDLGLKGTAASKAQQAANWMHDRQPQATAIAA